MLFSADTSLSLSTSLSATSSNVISTFSAAPFLLPYHDYPSIVPSLQSLFLLPTSIYMNKYICVSVKELSVSCNSL